MRVVTVQAVVRDHDSSRRPALRRQSQSLGAQPRGGPALLGVARRWADTMTSPVALIIGAGDATGGAIARRFAREGYVACVTRRSLEKLQPLLDRIKADGGQAHGYASDARKEEEVIALGELIESTLGPIEVLVFNIGANAPSSVLEETARKYFKIWEMACFGGFLNGREVAKRMVTRAGAGRQQTIIFTGATASIRGSANFSAFAGAKHALRALAQSMARELAPPKHSRCTCRR